MATILEFRPAGRNEMMPVLRAGRGGASAEIVFFPGVRYERWEASLPSTTRLARKKKRDKLEVND